MSSDNTMVTAIATLAAAVVMGGCTLSAAQIQARASEHAAADSRQATLDAAEIASDAAPANGLGCRRGQPS